MTENKAPIPFRQFVLKVHSRCDLACDHCYVYEHADTSWRGRPKAVSDAVLRQTAVRIAEHARVHGLDVVHVVLHGGEPLLLGPLGLRRAARELTEALRGVARLDLRVHTNGVTLSENFLRVFDEFDILVGISLDGDRAANDLHRRYADGRSSHDRVLRAVNLLRQPRWRHLYAGLLCTIDVRNDPIAVYDALVALDPPRIDFLLPHATWDTPPLRPDDRPTPYADWLLRIYARWNEQGRPVPVRMFDSLHRTLRGGSSLTESLGLAPADLVVIETDGTLEQADSLKTAFDGAPATGFDVFADDFDAAARHPGMIDRQQGLAGLCAQCRACPVVESCGGGLYAHRYATDSATDSATGPDADPAGGPALPAGGGFDHPSVFCPDLFSLITSVRDAESAPDAPAKEHPAMSDGLLTESQFDELASGYGGTAAVTALRSSQLELNRRLLDRIAERWAELDVAEPPGADAWELIARLDAGATEALDMVLAQPFTRSWALDCLAAPAEAAADFGGVAEIAAAAAIRAGWREKLRVPLRAEGLRLPGLGLLALPAQSTPPAPPAPPAPSAPSAPTEVRVVTERSGFTVETGDEQIRVELRGRSDHRWHPVHRVDAGGQRLALDDTDPQRRTHHWEPAEPMTDEEAAAWREELDAALWLVDTELREYAPGLRAGLDTVVPLRPGAEGTYVSGAARDVFGAVGIARPAGRPDLLALLLVHEFQHVKLGAVFDVADLFDRADSRCFEAPWRTDRRPFEGLFQGTYAHIAVVEFWRSRWKATGEESAREEYTRWLGHTWSAIRTLDTSGALTPSGVRFVARMRATVEPWWREEASDD